MKSIQEVATEGAKAQAAIDKYLTLAMKAAKRLEKVTETGVTLGMVKNIRGKILISQARAATGAIADAALAFAVLHKEQTIVCVENDCDVPALASVGGVTTMGGGDR
jgi:hypothetical protein